MLLTVFILLVESSTTTTLNNLDLHRVRVRAHVSCKEDLKLLAIAYWHLLSRFQEQIII